MLPLGTFKDQVSIITGGSSGIGLAIASEMGRLGSRLVLVGRSKDRLEAASAALREKDVRVVHYRGDVRDRPRVEEIVADVSKKLGQIDHLVNSAAGNFQIAPEDLTPNGWDAVVRIVLDGTWNFTQCVGQTLIRQGRGGSVLNIGTAAAVTGGPNTVHSSAAKAGVVSMTKSLASAWAKHGIRLNVLTPGLTEETGAASFLFDRPGAWEQQVRSIPMGRALTHEEVGDAAVYLLSDYARYVTGQNFIIDGGRSLGRGAGGQV